MQDFSTLENQLKKLIPREISDNGKDSILAELAALEQEENSFIESKKNSWWQFIRHSAALITIAIALFAGWQLGNSSGKKNSSKNIKITMPTNANDVTHLPLGVPVPGRKNEEYKPVAINTRVIGRIDDGLIKVGGQPPMRQMRYQLIDNIKWRDEKTNRVYEVDRPRTKTIYLPVESI